MAKTRKQLRAERLEAFETIVSTYEGALLRYTARVTYDISAAEDVVQETFIRLFKSWKDELVLVIFLTPMVMAFIPDLADYALQGFEIIEKMPEWYRYVIIGMVIVIYGLRGMAKQLISSKLGVKR